jgi:hypothetical protein
MIELIFYDKKNCVSNQNLETNKMACSNPRYFRRKDTVFLLHDLAFLLIKSKKKYKAKFSTNLILKKNQQGWFWKEKNP